MSPLVRRALVAAFIVSLSISGCKCGAKVAGQGCQSNDDCRAEFNGSNRAFCDTRQTPPTCALTPQKCDAAADCCPAQVCKTQGHYCFDNYTPCTKDSECPSSGEVCKEIGVFSKSLGCTWNKCDASNTCAPNTTCFNHYCVGAPPCNGGCTSPANPVCVTATNLCTPAPKDSTCAQTCPTGKILVLQNPDNIFDTCVPGTETCECDSLPPLRVNDVSRHSSIAAFGQNLFISAYDGEHGDLVLHTFDKNDLTKPTKTEWLDGLPASCAHIGGDVNGPRGGCTDPGPNVGMYTSIAASPTGDLYIAYYDVDDGDLKFTARYGGPAAPWTTPMTIDGSTPSGSAPSNGDVGMYASIALDKAGHPAIAYFRRGSYDPVAGTETGPSTGLLYAYATRAQPLTKDDWKVVGDVDALDRPPPPCNDACSSTQYCIVDPNAVGGQRCADKSSACASACTGNQACVADSDANHSPVCRATLADEALAELPRGVGLMPQLGFIDDTSCADQRTGCPVIAYFASIGVDPADGKMKSIPQLRAVRGTAVGTAPAFGAPVVIDGADADPQHAGQLLRPLRDTGRWPALAIGPMGAAGGRIAIAFPDRSNQQLLLYQSDGLTAHSHHADSTDPTGLIHLVDDGKPGPGEKWRPQGFPGAQTSIAFAPSGKIAIAFQDAAPVSLIFSVYDPQTQKRISRNTMQPSTGANGFWPHLIVASGTAYMESASIKAISDKTAVNPLHVTYSALQ